MDSGWKIILEILKYILPALIVFGTAYYLLKSHLESTQKIKAMEIHSSKSEKNLALKMQAYERLALFCERISIPNLLLRLRADKLNANTYRQSLILAVQQEFEHNFSQQIYTSDKLWEIVSLAKNQIIEIINLSEGVISPTMTSQEYIQLMLTSLQNLSKDPTRMAIQAIKQEVRLYL